MEVPFLIIVAFLLALLIKTFLVQAFYIPSPSMVPTLEHGDRVLVNKLAYRMGEPARGQIVVFRNPNPPPRASHGPILDALRWLGDTLGVGLPSDEFLIKRIIGLPGETVSVKGDGVYVDGRKLSEPYVNQASGPGPLGTWRVPAGSVFVMGDNRGDSEDSRVFGPIPISSIVGRAFLRIWPPSRWGGL